MLKRVVRLFITHDSLRQRTRDEVLRAIDPGKCLALGRVWVGELRPVLDSGLAALEPLVTGLTSGRVLHAQELSNVTDLGRAWVGDLLSRLRAAARDAASAADPRVDLGPVLAEAERLDVQLRSAAPNNGRAIGDGLARLRRAAARVGSARTGDTVNPLTRLATLTPEQRASGPNSAANLRAREFWRAQTAPATPGRAIGDSSAAQTTAVRDELAVAARAKHPRERMEALNRAARAFWAS